MKLSGCEGKTRAKVVGVDLIKLYQIKIHYIQAVNSRIIKKFKKKNKKANMAEFLNLMNINFFLLFK